MRHAIVLLVAACSGGGGDDGGGSDGGTTPTHTGYVSIQSYDAMNAPSTPTRGGTASAGFFATGSFCTTGQTIGACEIATCPTTTPAGVSAGAITISGAAQAITLMPMADNSYATFMAATPLFNGGESITFAAAGGEVPAFMKAITTPTKATITAPAKPSSSSPYLMMSRSSDFTVSWTGGGSGQLQVALNSIQGDARVFCRFDAGAGTAKIPSAALQTLEAGNIGFAMASIARTTQDTGDWAVEVSAYFNAVWPDNSIVSGPAMLQ